MGVLAIGKCGQKKRFSILKSLFRRSLFVTFHRRVGYIHLLICLIQLPAIPGLNRPLLLDFDFSLLELALCCQQCRANMSQDKLQNKNENRISLDRFQRIQHANQEPCLQLNFAVTRNLIEKQSVFVKIEVGSAGQNFAT